jgi:hypothetical protein
MPKKSNSRAVFPNLYMVAYLCFFLLELAYVFLILSPYGDSNGRFNSFYVKIKQNLNYFLVFGFIFLTFFTMIFPGIGWLFFMITLYKIADFCCKQKEAFEQDLYYGWGRYYPESATIYNEAELERINDASYSAAEGDVEDIDWLSKLYPNNELLFKRDNCTYNNQIIPAIMTPEDEMEIEQKPFISNNGCNRIDIKTYGSIFEDLNTPRGLLTSSLLAKEMRIA